MKPDGEEPKCLGHCGENAEGLLIQFGIEKGECIKCPWHEKCVETY